MAFKKIAKLQLKQVYASDGKGNFGWRDFVKEANKTLNTNSEFLPKEAYEYDTKNFVYIKARAISGMEKWGPNGNGDAFPWEELKKSYPSFIAKGFYIEHQEDDEKDAKGIILDAEPNDEEQFIVCLCAVDKNEYPEICKDIVDEKLNQVSMSCLAASCECSLCHNVAHSQEELCQHQNPQSPLTYCKNMKDENGNTIYEINRDIVFTGLSGVAVPADKDAFISEIRASKKTLENELTKYNKAKLKHIEAGKMKELKACIDELMCLPVNQCLEQLSSDISEAIRCMLANEEDHPNCNKVVLDHSLQLLTKVKFALNTLAEEVIEETSECEESAEAQLEQSVPPAVIEQPTEPVVPPTPEEDTIGEKVELQAKKLNRKIAKNQSKFWFKLK